MITSMMGRMADAEKLSIPQLQMAIKNGTIPAYVGVPLLQDKVKQQQQAMAMQQQQGQQAPIADQVMQEADQYRGIDELPTNLPTAEDDQTVDDEYANGGIIAFADTGAVKEPKKSFWDTVDPAKYQADPAYKAFVDEPDTTDKTYKNYLEMGNTPPPTKDELQTMRYNNAFAFEKNWLNSPEGKQASIQAQQMGEPEVTLPSKVNEQYWAEVTGNPKRGTEMAEYVSGLREGDLARMRTPPTPVNPETASDRAAVLNILKKGWAASQDVGSGMTRGVGTVADYFNRGIRALGVPETLAPRIPDQYTFNRNNQGLTPFSDALRASNTPATTSAPPPQGRLPVAGGDTGAFQAADRGITTLPAGQRGDGTTATPASGAGQRGVAPTDGSGTVIPTGNKGTGAGGALPPTLSAAEKSDSPIASQAVSMLDRYVEMLEKSGKDVSRDKKEALYMALIKGGLAAAGGTSPNALANIAAGVVPAMEGYSKEIAGIRKDERARLEKLVAAGVSKEKILNEAKKLGITEKHYDDWYKAETAKLGVMSGNRADARAQAEDMKRLSVAQGLFKTLRSDQLMSGKSDDDLWNQAQIMSGQIEAPTAPKSNIMGSYVPGKGYVPAGK